MHRENRTICSYDIIGYGSSEVKDFLASGQISELRLITKMKLIGIDRVLRVVIGESVENCPAAMVGGLAEKITLTQLPEPAVHFCACDFEALFKEDLT